MIKLKASVFILYVSLASLLVCSDQLFQHSDRQVRDLSFLPRLLPVLTHEETLISNITIGDQTGIPFDDGSYLVIWANYTTSSKADILARRYDVNNKPGPIFQVSSAGTTNPENNLPDGVQLIDGSYVIVWQDSHNRLTSYPNVYAQRFHANDTKYGSQKLVFSGGGYMYRHPRVLRRMNGG
jgi:hypothetical protein